MIAEFPDGNALPLRQGMLDATGAEGYIHGIMVSYRESYA
jgi:hypothetical protein